MFEAPPFLVKTVSSSGAGTAVALPVRLDSEVTSGKWMPATALRLSCIPGREAHSTEVVDRRRDHLHVGHIDARTIAAQMVDGEAGRNWASLQFPLNAVGRLGSAVYVDAAVTMAVLGANPYMAATYKDCPREPLFDWRTSRCHRRRILA